MGNSPVVLPETLLAICYFANQDLSADIPKVGINSNADATCKGCFLET